jgi:rubrerythrin
MKNSVLKLFILLLVICTINTRVSANNFGAKGAYNKSSLSLQEMLTYAIQDEYLAKAEYEEVIEIFGAIRPFSNIIRAEVRHINMLKPLFNKYNFNIPVDTAKQYVVFPNTIEDALEIGVQAEIENIDMYNTFLKKNIPNDVKNISITSSYSALAKYSSCIA